MLTLDRTQVLQHVFCPSKGVLAKQPPRFHGTAADVLVVLVGWDFPSGFTWLAGKPTINGFAMVLPYPVMGDLLILITVPSFTRPLVKDTSACFFSNTSFYYSNIECKTLRYTDHRSGNTSLQQPVLNRNGWSQTQTYCKENLEGQSQGPVFCHSIRIHTPLIQTYCDMLDPVLGSILGALL